MTVTAKTRRPRVPPSPERTALIRAAHAQGRSNPAIAHELGLEETTIRRELGSKDNTQRNYSAKSTRLVIRPLDPDKCGTPAQARAHQRRGERPCPLCLRAMITYRQRRKERRSRGR